MISVAICHPKNIAKQLVAGTMKKTIRGNKAKDFCYE